MGNKNSQYNPENEFNSQATMVSEQEGDENAERGNWSGKLDFILSCIGYAVGLGNVWRFPYLAYTHGGAIFLIPYFLSLMLIGLPIFLLELSLGQFTSSGPLTCWKMAPFFQGLGACMLVVSCVLAIYYNVIIGWSIYYLAASFSALPDLPWTYCDSSWATKYCETYIANPNTINSTWQCATYNGYNRSDALYVPFPNGVCAGIRPEQIINTTDWFVPAGTDNSPEVIKIGTFLDHAGQNVTWAFTKLQEFALNAKDQAVSIQAEKDLRTQKTLPGCAEFREMEANIAANHTTFLFDSYVGTQVKPFDNSSYLAGAVGFWDEKGAKDLNITRQGASVEYFFHRVLRQNNSQSMCEMGEMHWDLCLCLLVAWLIVFLCLIKGIKSSGKVVYFTALFPYLILFILMIVGAIQDGSLDGVLFYLRGYGTRPEDHPLSRNYTSLTDFYSSKLGNIDVWKAASEQIFFSLSACYGGLIALSSYNRFGTNVMRDTLIVTFGNCLTSFFAGFVVFSFLGALANSLDVSVSDVTDSGIALAFVVYPNAVTRIPPPPLWSILFFIMLLTLGLDSEFALMETLLTSVTDTLPAARKHKTKVIALLCSIFFLFGLSMCTDGGLYMLNLLDTFGAGWNVLFIAVAECICVAHVYGHRNHYTRFTKDIETMLGKDSCWPWSVLQYVWMVMWGLVTPIICTVLFFYSLVSFAEKGDNVQQSGYRYEAGFVALGWLITGLILAVFVAGVVLSFVKNGITESFFPLDTWGPALPEHRKLCLDYCDMIVDPENTDIDLDNPESSTQQLSK